MRKVAVFCSGEGECAYRLVSLFNEGNRIRVECVICVGTHEDTLQKFADSDVEVAVIPEEKWRDSPADAMALISGKDIELIALDNFPEELPSEIEEAYAGKILRLSSVEEAPREVVAAFTKIDAGESLDAIPGEEEEVAVPPVPKSADEEWAETLHIKYDRDMANVTPPPIPGSNPPFNNTSDGSGAPAEAPFVRNYGPMNAAYSRQQQEPMPSTYLALAIIMAIFCCTVPGIVAIIFSSQVASRYANGDYEGARKASRNTEIWIIVSFVLGVMSATLYLPIMMLS